MGFDVLMLFNNSFKLDIYSRSSVLSVFPPTPTNYWGHRHTTHGGHFDHGRRWPGGWAREGVDSRESPKCRGWESCGFFFMYCGMLNSVHSSFRFLATLRELRNSTRKPPLKVKRSRQDNVIRTLLANLIYDLCFRKGMKKHLHFLQLWLKMRKLSVRSSRQSVAHSLSHIS